MRNNYVLIIAKNPKTADKFCAFLEKAGCQALAVTTGARAQVQLAFTNPDVILLDMDLPDIPGEIILRQIRAQTRLKDSILILVTGDQEIEKTLQPQADLVLSKPMDVSQIRSLVMHSVEVSG